MSDVRKFKKGDVVTFPYSLTITWDKYTGTVVSRAKYVNKYRIRLRPPITSSMFKGTVDVQGSQYTVLINPEQMEFDTVETVKSIMRRKTHGKKKVRKW